MPQLSENKPPARGSNRLPLLLGGIAVVALIVVVVTFIRPATASNAPALTPLAVVLQATAIPPTPLPTANPVQADTGAANGARVSGNFSSVNQVSLAFSPGGRVTQLPVKEGSQVKKGDLLVALDTATLELQVSQAQAGLAIAQARLDQAKTGGTPTDLLAAQAAVAAAQSNFNRVAQGPTPDDLAIARSNLDKAKAALDQAQAAYDRAGGPTNAYVNQLPTTLNLELATSNYQAALAGYNLARNHPTEPELAAAAVQLAQAQSVLARLTPTGDDLTIAQAQVDQAQAALDLAKQSLANAKLVAPFDGTVVWLGPHVSEMVGSNAPVVILADLSQMQVQANVDEITLAGLKLGQPAVLSVDALGGKTLNAHLSKIGSYAPPNGGLVSVPVTLAVDSANAGVYPGLSATVQFQAQP
jgi:multidrug resistance efflux pump